MPLVTAGKRRFTIRGTLKSAADVGHGTRKRIRDTSTSSELEQSIDTHYGPLLAVWWQLPEVHTHILGTYRGYITYLDIYIQVTGKAVTYGISVIQGGNFWKGPVSYILALRRLLGGKFRQQITT